MKTFGSETTQGNSPATSAKVKFDDSAWSTCKIRSITKDRGEAEIILELYGTSIPQLMFSHLYVKWRSFEYAFDYCNTVIFEDNHRLRFNYTSSVQVPKKNRLWLINKGITNVDGISVHSTALTCEHMHKARYPNCGPKPASEPLGVLVVKSIYGRDFYVTDEATWESASDSTELQVIHLKSGKQYLKRRKLCEAVSWDDVPHTQQQKVLEKYQMKEKKEKAFIKYRNGNAWYYCDQADWDEAVDDDKYIDIYHLLTGHKYERVDPDSLASYPWDNIPESFRADALAANHEIKHYIKGETEPMYQETTNGMFDFGRFGQMNTDQVVMSPKGLAIKFVTKNGHNKFRSWDKDKNVMTDVTGLTVPLSGMLFIMPCKKLVVGDIIDHDGEFAFIKEANDDGSYVLLGPSGELSQHIKTTSLMGFNFYRKVVTPMKRFGGDDGIMGMMKMNMMMSMMNGQGGGGGMQQMLMMQMMGKDDSSGFGDLFDFDGLFGDDEEGK